MPYEFHCKFCHATIRVKDNAGGGKGRCPKCGMRITVPKKTAKKPAEKLQVPDEPFVIPGVTDETIIQLEPATVDAPMVETEPAEVVFKSMEATQPGVVDFPSAPSPAPVVAPSKSAARRLKQQKLRNRSIMIAGITVIAIFVIAAVVLIPVLTTERLTGDLTASTAATLELPAVPIEISRVKVAPEDLTVLLKKLELAPLPMTSNTMQIQLSGTSKGLQVSVAAGTQAQFYRVNLKTNDAIQKYLGQHQEELEEQRLKEIDLSVTEFFTQYQKVLAKKSTSESISVFRDTLAIPSLVRGFGNQVVAAHGRGLYRCIYEDRDGGLYFLLPADVREFELRGREDVDGRVVVPAEFKVKVEGEIIEPKKADDQKQKKPDTKSKTKKDAGTTESSEEGMKGDK